MSGGSKKRTKKVALDVIALSAGFPQVLETSHAIGQDIRSSSSDSSDYRSACQGKSTRGNHGGFTQNSKAQRKMKVELQMTIRGKSFDERQIPNRALPTSISEINTSKFSALPGQNFYSTQIPVWLVKKLGIAEHYEN